MNTASAMKTIPFNLNVKVRVKLTAAGKAYLAMKHAMLCMSTGVQIEHVPPREDADGWAEFPLWELMSRFGDEMYQGNTLMPIEMDVLVVVEGDAE